VCAMMSLASQHRRRGRHPPQDITVLAGPVLVGAEPAHAPHVEFQSHFSVDPVGTAFFGRRRENRLRRDEGLEHAKSCAA
jgi:hypothetical protein